MNLIIHLSAEADVSLLALYDGITWKTWQAKILRLIKCRPSDRQIMWIIDEIGNAGKSYLARYLSLTEDAVVYENCKSADLKHHYSGQQIVMFDFVRSLEEYVNYSILESVKNGSMFSSKYDSCIKRYKIPHVFVFANFHPDKSKLSADRWIIRFIDGDDWIKPV